MFINELVLYTLIRRSESPKAEECADWVRSEVLPDIMNACSYTPSEEETKRCLLTADDPAYVDKLVNEPEGDNKLHYEFVSYIKRLSKW